MQFSAQGARGPTSLPTRARTDPSLTQSPAARVTLRTGVTVALAVGLVIGAAAGSAAATDGAEAQTTSTLPWYITVVSSLVAAGISAGVTLRATHRTLTQGQRDRRQDRAAAEARQAALRAENELRDKKIANRTAWTPHYRRIDDLLVSVGRIEYEIRRRRLHADDPETAELLHARKAAEQYAAYAPGRLQAALSSLADSLDSVHTHLLPAAAVLDSAEGAGPPARWQALFACAAEQARAADNLTRTLTDTQAALRHEWGMD
ncbi:hypothetical protein GCM10010278_81090 [Streptomyces melanogenes]|nr:hypothetical protein GCM10010278_81090 [Streptomyces melanogenes]